VHGTVSQSVPERKGASQALASILDRIEATIDAETSAFNARAPIDLADINQRKRQGLLELSRVMPALPRDVLGEELRRRLMQLSDKLETNRRVLDVQLRAVREVADIIAATLRDAEHDGTYSMFAAF
jgi:hypothetical protein